MAMNQHKGTNDERSQDEHHPRTISKFSDRKDAHNDGSTDRSKTVADHFEEPTFFVVQFMTRSGGCSLRLEMTSTPPTTCHACLGQREGQKNANGIQRDQTRHTGLKNNDQQGCNCAQGNNAIGIYQPTAAISQLARHESIFRQHSTQTRETSKGGI